MKTTARTIQVKVNFNPDEYVSFRDKCAAADVSQSKALRDLAGGWPGLEAPSTWQGIDKAKNIRPIVISQRPSVGPRKSSMPSPQQPRGTKPLRSLF